MFDVVISADWSVTAAKRWIARAERSDACWQVTAVEPAPDPPLAVLPRRARALVGFDFPIGVPEAYGRRAKVERFPAFLCALGRGAYASFYEPASAPKEIALERPFYPRRPGGTSRQQLVTGLGLDEATELYRLCERRTPRRAAASPLFWTLGAKQVGRAAIAGWRDVLAPALRSRDHDLALWPFDGALDELARTHETVACEIYPAEALALVVRPTSTWSKRREEDRRAIAPALLEHLEAHGVHVLPRVRTLVERGFLEGPSGEDPFDAFLGLVLMLDVVERRVAPHPFTTLPFPLRRWEGWILGQQDIPDVESRSQDMR